MKKIVSVLALSALLMGGLSACSNDTAQADPQYARVCVDQNGDRVPGNECGTGTSSSSDAFLWWYILYGSTLPRYGYHVNGGYSHISSSASYARAETAPAGKSYSKPGTSTYQKIKNTIPKIKKAPAPAPAPKAGTPAKPAPAPKVNKAPVVKAPAPAPRPVAPRPAAPRPPTTRR